MLKIDKIDRKILGVLQENARVSNAELAEKVGVSASPCWRRVRRLEEAGVIKKYVTLLDSTEVGLGVNVFVQIHMGVQKGKEIEELEKVILARPEVMECYRMTGDSDYLVRIAVADIAAYEDFMSRVLLNLPGAANVNSSFALKQVKYNTALPVEAG